MFLRRLFRKKCQEYKCENPFNTDVDFELLPLRQKVEILKFLCEFRLDAEDAEESLSDLDSDSLRVEPLGHDRKNSAYWYFYGTRLYREDYIGNSTSINTVQKQKKKSKDKRHKRCWSRVAEEKEEEEKKEDCKKSIFQQVESIWQVVCFTLQDWSRLVEKFRDSKYITEQKLYKTLSENFLPEIPKLFDLKEKRQRCKILQRNNSYRFVNNTEKENITNLAMVKSKVKTRASSNKDVKKGSSNRHLKSTKREEEVPVFPTKKGRQTNNSLASAVGQILIETKDAPIFDNKKDAGKVKNVTSKYPYNSDIEEEERRIGMYKVLNIVKDHEDAWPFTDPVEEQYAPRYYSVVRRPMDLNKMEEKLDRGSYNNIAQFKRDFSLIVENCRQYNGSDNEYTEMAMNLKKIFERAIDRYLESELSSDDDKLSLNSKNISSSPGASNKLSSPPIQRHMKSRKSTRNAKSNKIKTKEVSDESDKNEESDVEMKSPIKAKKRTKKSKSNSRKHETEEEEDEEEVEEEGEDEAEEEKKSKRNDVSNRVKLKKRKTADVDRRVTRKEKCLKEDSFEEESPKQKKSRHEKHQNMSSIKETKENKKRKEHFEEECDISDFPKTKTRKIEKKKENKESSILTEIPKRNKIKEESTPDASPVKEKKSSLSSPNSTKKSKVKKKEEKVKKLFDSDCKVADSKLKKGIDVKKESKVKYEGFGEDEYLSKLKDKKTPVLPKIESLDIKKDIEFLDGLKDKINARRKEERLKMEREKKKKKSLKGDSPVKPSKNVPSNGSNYHYNVNKLSSEKLKSKKISKENTESNTQYKEKISEPKKLKNSSNKRVKTAEKDENFEALNQATEQTLNDINKWLDDAPRLSEFSSGSDSPVAESTRQSKHDALRKKPSVTKHFGQTQQQQQKEQPQPQQKEQQQASAKPKKVQRTIDRLQPGKSKGNLLSKKLNDSGASDNMAKQSSPDSDQAKTDVNIEPKLSLGSVLKNVESIQLICKSIVSSPTTPLSNDADDEDKEAAPTALVSKIEEENNQAKKSPADASQKPKKEEGEVDNEETLKPKSATPNLSAWFKAFGGPKSKKKEEEEESASCISTKKDEVPENNGNRQRRISTGGGSSASESVSSFSQESPSSSVRVERSPQNPQPIPAVLPMYEQQVRGAGFYQDALSTGSSPYSSPYYTTPPRYSAQLPPTPSPQNHPLSPAYTSPAVYDQTPHYSQVNPQNSLQMYQKMSQSQSPSTVSQESPQNCFSQNSPQSDTFSNPHSVPSQHGQSQSLDYPQPSPQSQSSPHTPQSQPSPQAANFSQPSPQQPPMADYSQPSPQQVGTNNFVQPLAQNTIKYPQPLSMQQPNSPYSQPSQPSPQQQHSPYINQQSPQPQTYSQVSPRPPSNYSQHSPLPPSYSTPQTPSPYSQPSQSDMDTAQPSPQARYQQQSQQTQNYSQRSPQTAGFAQPSPQTTPSPYAAQPSPQAVPNYSEQSPQTSANYSQSQSSQQQRPYNVPLQQLPQSVPQQQNSYPPQQPIAPFPTKPSENYTSQNLMQLPMPQQQLKPAAYNQPVAPTPTIKPAPSKPKIDQPINQQIYDQNAAHQYSHSFTGNVMPVSDRGPSQANCETAKLPARPSSQAADFRQGQRSDQSDLLNFQQNLAPHETLYANSFQETPYGISNSAHRAVYSSYYDNPAKNISSSSSFSNNLTTAKKAHNDPNLSHHPQGAPQDQYGFNPLLTGQLDSGFGSSLSGSNPAYSHLGLGLVGRSGNDTNKQMLPAPVPQTAPTTANKPGRPKKSEQSGAPAAKSKRGRKSKQQTVVEQPTQPPVTQPVGIDQQSSLLGFAQYPSASNDPMGLKNAAAVAASTSAFNFASAGSADNNPFYGKDASAAAAAYAFLDDFRNPNMTTYYNVALREQQQRQQQERKRLPPQAANPTVTDAAPQAGNYSAHPFLHSAQRPTPYTPNLPAHYGMGAVDAAAYQRYLHSFYSLQPPPHHGPPTWL